MGIKLDIDWVGQRVYRYEKVISSCDLDHRVLFVTSGYKEYGFLVCFSHTDIVLISSGDLYENLNIFSKIF